MDKPRNLQMFLMRDRLTGRTFCVVGRDYDEAQRTATFCAVQPVYAGINGSLPGVYVHPLRQEWKVR